jgi:hypothetical protein
MAMKMERPEWWTAPKKQDNKESASGEKRPEALYYDGQGWIMKNLVCRGINPPTSNHAG